MSPPSYNSPPRLQPRQSSTSSSAPASAPSALAFQPSCPSGGKFWVCTTGSRFVGCCDTEKDPCALGCTAGALRITSFNASAYGTFPDLECSNTALFYTCTKTKPAPFMGCCKSNPCKGGVGCDQTNLGGALLPQNAAASAYYVTSTPTAAPGTSTGTAMAETQPEHHHGISTGAIVGISISVFFVILGLIAAFAWFCGRGAGRKSAKGQRGHFIKLPQQEDRSPMHSRGSSYEYVRVSGEHPMMEQIKRERYSPYTDSFPSPTPTYQPFPVTQSGHNAPLHSPSPRHATFSHAHSRTISHEMPLRNTIVAELEDTALSPHTAYQPPHPDEAHDDHDSVPQGHQSRLQQAHPISTSPPPQPQPHFQPQPQSRLSPQPQLRHKPRLQSHQIQILRPIDVQQYDPETSSIQRSPEDGRLTDQPRGFGMQMDGPEIRVETPPPDYYANDIAKR